MPEKITVTDTIHADPQKTWDYYTQPSHIVHWNFADPSWHCPSASNDMKVGGTYKARMEARDGSFGFDFEAIYTDITMGKGFSYAFGGRTATVRFEPLGDETVVTVIFDPETQNPPELQKKGWQSILDNFKQYTETH